MKDIKKIFSKFLNEKIIEIKEFKAGFLSNWFKIIWENKNYFARCLKDEDLWYIYNNEDYSNFSISDKMTNNAKSWIKSYWVIKYNNKTYHITDFFEWETLSLQDINEDYIIKIANKIWQIHKIWNKELKKLSNNNKKFLYNRSLREIITHPETVFSTYEIRIVNTEDEDFFKRYIWKMLETYFKYVKWNTFDRISYLHGDFWQWNIMKNKNENIEFIDFSRIPYGEPGIDIWWFLAQFQIDSIINFENKEKNNNLQTIFLENYIKITQDENILEYIKLWQLWVGFINLSPLLQQFLKWNKTKKDKVKDWAISL